MGVECRTTLFSNYAEANCPSADKKLPTLCIGAGRPAADSEARAGPWWSLMFEISESQYKPVEWQRTVQVGSRTWPKVVLDTIQGAINTKLITPDVEIVSAYHRRCATLFLSWYATHTDDSPFIGSHVTSDFFKDKLYIGSLKKSFD